MNNTQNNLYHYTNFEKLFMILSTMSLKLGKFENVNDPKESKIWNFKFFCLRSESKETFNIGLFDQISSFILKRSNILCLSKDNTLENPDDIESLNKGYNYPRMWSHYAKDHKGACLVFNKSQLESDFDISFEKNKRFKGDIEYVNSIYGPKIVEKGLPIEPYGIFYEQLIQQGLEKYMNSHIQKYYKFLYFYKHFDWRDENEYRFVFLSEKENEEYFLPIKNSLSEIIITEDFPENRLIELIEYCKILKIKLTKIVWRGWALHEFSVSTNNKIDEVISFNGTSYPTHFYYELLYSQACDMNGSMRPILIDFTDNNKVILIK